MGLQGIRRHRAIQRDAHYFAAHHSSARGQAPLRGEWPEDLNFARRTFRPDAATRFQVLATEQRRVLAEMLSDKQACPRIAASAGATGQFMFFKRTAALSHHRLGDELLQDMSDMPPVLLRGQHANQLLLALGQRERGTLGALLASGRIGSAELLAANRWYQAFAMAEHGAFDADQAGRGGGIKLFAQERQLAATTSYRLAVKALSKAGDDRMRAILGSGLSVAALATRMKQDRRVMAGMVVADLMRLVDHYTETDQTRGAASRA